MKLLKIFALWLVPLLAIKAQTCPDTVKLSMTYVYSATQLEVSIRVQNFQNINAFQFAVEYDDNVATFLSSSSPLTGFGDQNYQLQEGHIRFLYDSNLMHSLSDGDELLVMVFSIDPISSSLRVAISELALGVEFVNDNQELLCYVDTPLTVPANGHKLGGKVTYDANSNCQLDSDEWGLNGWLVELSYLNRKYYRNTNEEGYFEFVVPEGVYTLRLIPPSEIWGACEDIIRATVTQQDPNRVDFLASKYIDCPKIKTNVAASFLKICENNTYSLLVENQGTQAVEDVEILIEYDEFLSFVSSTGTVRESGSNFILLELGRLDIYERDTIKMDFFLSCEAKEGQTHCLTASATQKNPCFVSSSWSGADLQIASECDMNRGQVKFSIVNTGMGDMLEMKRYIVTEDEVIRWADDINLIAQSSVDIEMPANGATYRIFVPQTTDYPYLSQVATLAIEGCTAMNGAEFSKGFVTIFEESDRDVFIDKLCLESSREVDPLLIFALPKGYGTNRYIENETQIEYIIEFENFKEGIIKDLSLQTYLSEDFDMTTLQMGASSHPYSYYFNRDRDLMISLDDIFLYSGQRGYIKFNIYPRSGLQNETKITMRVQAFDNLKALTQPVSTFHTIGQNYIVVTSTEWKGEALNIQFYPNPTQEILTLDMSQIDFSKGHFKVFTLDGMLVKSGSLDKGLNSIEFRDVPQACYLLSLSTDEKNIVTYKIIKQ